MRTHIPSLKKTVAVGVVGNILEWYDLTLYGFFSPIIAKLFFPNDNPLISLISTFGVFAIGFLIRPLGACLFGSIGDRLGRKRALLISILLMAVSTFLMGLMPTFAQVGILAPILLILLRLLQGLSISGEWTSSIVFLTEHAPPEKKGFVGSWVYFGSGIGWMLGSMASAVTALLFTQEDLFAWAWRCPFLLALLTGGFAFYVRSFSQETEDFIALQQAKKISQHPIKDTFRQSKKLMVVNVGTGFISHLGGYLIYAYMPTYLNQTTGMPMGQALMINTIALGLFTLLVPIAGWISDQIGRIPLLMLSCMGLILFAYPLFLILQQGTFALSLTALLALTVLMALFQGPFPAFMHELFPARLRASGLALSYNLSAALFAGTTPLVCTLLIEQTGTVMAPAGYLILAAFTSLTILFFQQKKVSVKQAAQIRS